MSLFNKAYALSFTSLFNALARRSPVEPAPLNLPPKNPAPRILAFTCAGIGDTLTDSVVFKALKETWPQAFLGAVVHRRRRFLVTHNPFIDRIFQFHKGYYSAYQLYHELHAAAPWDAILHLRGNDPEPRCLSFLLNPSVTVSVPNMTKLGHLCGHHVTQPDWDDTHGVEQTLRIARSIGADTPYPHLVYQVTPAEKAALEPKLASLWSAQSFDSIRPRIVFQIGGGRRANWRDWPAERYSELITLLHPLYPAEFILLAGPEKVLQEKAKTILATVSSKVPGPLRLRNAVAQLNLAQSAALLASSRLLVSTDTGIMHLGFAVGTRVVALIHYRNPSSRVGPYKYGSRHLVHQLVRPQPELTPDPGMAAITAQEVAESVAKIWAEESVS